MGDSQNVGKHGWSMKLNNSADETSGDFCINYRNAFNGNKTYDFFNSNNSFKILRTLMTKALIIAPIKYAMNWTRLIIKQ